MSQFSLSRRNLGQLESRSILFVCIVVFIIVGGCMKAKRSIDEPQWPAETPFLLVAYALTDGTEKGYLLQPATFGRLSAEVVYTHSIKCPTLEDVAVQLARDSRMKEIYIVKYVNLPSATIQVSPVPPHEVVELQQKLLAKFALHAKFEDMESLGGAE
jgi:hypothetical protein